MRFLSALKIAKFRAVKSTEPVTEVNWRMAMHFNMIAAGTKGFQLVMLHWTSLTARVEYPAFRENEVSACHVTFVAGTFEVADI